MDSATRRVLSEARTMIVDLMTGWPVKELHKTPLQLGEEITGLLGDANDSVTAEEMNRLKNA